MNEIAERMLEILPRRRRRSFARAQDDEISLAVHDAILDYARHPDQFDPGCAVSLAQFLLHAAYNNLLDLFRANQRRRFAEGRYAEQLVREKGISWEPDVIEGRLDSDLLRTVLSAFTNHRDRELLMRWADRAPLQELAGLLAVSHLSATEQRQEVKRVIQRVVRYLRRRLRRAPQ